MLIQHIGCGLRRSELDGWGGWGAKGQSHQKWFYLQKMDKVGLKIKLLDIPLKQNNEQPTNLRINFYLLFFINLNVGFINLLSFLS